MATINLKNVAFRFGRSLMLSTGKKMGHLDSEDSESEDGHHLSSQPSLIDCAKK